MDFFLHPVISPQFAATGLVGLESLKIGQGFAASPGAAVGCLVFTPAEAIKRFKEGDQVILCLDQAHYDDEIVIKVKGIV